MTSVTYGMRKSLCKVTFDMYQGALASYLNVLQTVSVVTWYEGNQMRSAIMRVARLPGERDELGHAYVLCR
jgi:hypothetical protein